MNTRSHQCTNLMNTDDDQDDDDDDDDDQDYDDDDDDEEGEDRHLGRGRRCVLKIRCSARPRSKWAFNKTCTGTPNPLQGRVCKQTYKVLKS